jgi:HlyD family secretion protein
MRRLIVVLVLAAFGAAGLWYGVGHTRPESAAEPAFRTAAIDRGSIVAAVSATGTINPTATAIVGSQVSGQVVEILADYNSAVKAGDILARLNSEQIRAKLDAARADLDQARAANQIQRATVEKVRAEIERLQATGADAEASGRRADAQLADAERTLARQQELRRSGIASEVALQQAQTQVLTLAAARDQAQAQIRAAAAQVRSLAAELKVAEAQVLSSEAQVAQRQAVLRQIEVDIRNSEIRSPVDGVVVQRSIELGQTVAASLQAPTLFLVAQDLTRIEIYANVDEADVGRVQDGQEVTFSVTAFPAREFRGRVKTVRLASQTVQNVVIYTAVIDVENRDLALKPGMTATLRIFTERREDVLRVSNAALRWRPPGEAAPAAPPQQPMPNPFSAAPSGAPMGGPGGQNAGRQMLERMAAELRLDEAQRKELETIAREVRQAASASGAPETPEARRQRGRESARQIGERLRPLLRADQIALLEAWQETRGGRGAGGNGVPGRLYILDGEGKAVLTQVRLGATDGTHTELIAGAQEGQRAVIGGGPRQRSPGFGGPRMF